MEIGECVCVHVLDVEFCSKHTQKYRCNAMQCHEHLIIFLYFNCAATITIVCRPSESEAMIIWSKNHANTSYRYLSVEVHFTLQQFDLFCLFSRAKYGSFTVHFRHEKKNSSFLFLFSISTIPLFHSIINFCFYFVRKSDSIEITLKFFSFNARKIKETTIIKHQYRCVYRY